MFAIFDKLVTRYNVQGEYWLVEEHRTIDWSTPVHTVLSPDQTRDCTQGHLQGVKPASTKLAQFHGFLPPHRPASVRSRARGEVVAAEPVVVSGLGGLPLLVVDLVDN